MSQYGSAVEYALHCLLFLARADEDARSARDVAEFQKLSTDYVAKLFTRLEKAGLVRSIEGRRGGFCLDRPPDDITVLEVVDAVEGRKPLFECREVRRNCVLFDQGSPRWSGQGICGIHATMLRAESAMRASLAETTLGQLGAHATEVVPKSHMAATQNWFQARSEQRRSGNRKRSR